MASSFEDSPINTSSRCNSISRPRNRMRKKLKFRTRREMRIFRTHLSIRTRTSTKSKFPASTPCRNRAEIKMKHSVEPMSKSSMTKPSTRTTDLIWSTKKWKPPSWLSSKSPKFCNFNSEEEATPSQKNEEMTTMTTTEEILRPLKNLATERREKFWLFQQIINQASTLAPTYEKSCEITDLLPSSPMLNEVKLGRKKSRAQDYHGSEWAEGRRWSNHL